MKKLTAPLALVAITALTTLTGCPYVKPIARTALEAARYACQSYAEQTGVSWEDICKTEEQLRPFLDAILAAQAQAAAASAGAPTPCTCPECPQISPTPPPAPTAPATTSSPLPQAPEKK